MVEALQNINEDNLVNGFEAFKANSAAALKNLVTSTAATRTIYSLTNDAIRADAVGDVDPMQEYSNRKRLNYATMALNYAKVPYANTIAEAGVRLSMGLADRQALTEATSKTVMALIPVDQINAIVAEIEARMQAVQNLIANIGAAVAAAAGSFIAADKVTQAKLDFKLISGQLGIITELIDKIAGGLSSKEAGPANIKNIIDVVMQVLDLLTQVIDYIEQLADKMTPEEYERLLKLVEYLDKNRKGINKPTMAQILQTILVVALDMIRPYITNLIMMLTMECFNAIMSVIKKIPGAGGVFPPPLDLIPAAVSLIVMVISGNLTALIGRLKDDIEVLYNFIRASVIVSVSSDASITAAEAAIAKDEAAKANAIVVPNADEMKQKSELEMNAIDTNNDKVDATTSDIVETAKATTMAGDVTKQAQTNLEDITKLAEAEKQAAAATAESIAEAEAANDKLMNTMLLNKYEVVYGQE